MRSPIKYYGGKFYLRTNILEIMDRYFLGCRRYAEPFAGGLSILLAKKKSDVEIVNDLNVEVIDFWRTLRDDYWGLISVIDEFNYDRKSFELSKGWIEKSGVERIGYWFVNNRLSFAGQGESFSWNGHIRRGMCEKISAYLSSVQGLELVSERLRDVEIYNADFMEILEGYDDCNTLIYSDPPYLKSSRSTQSDVYEHELPIDRHREMIDWVNRCKANVIVSHYEHPLYMEGLRELMRMRIDVFNRTGNKTGTMATEYLWIKI